MTPSTQFQDLVGEFYSRRLLLVNPSPAPSADHDTEIYGSDNNFDSNVIMVLSVLFCGIICSFGLNAIIRCILRCSSSAASDSPPSGVNRAASIRISNTGVKRKTVKTFPVVNYSADLNLLGLNSECVICLSEFTQDERVRLMPKCNHGFHVRCIDKWLSLHSSCPTCRHNLIDSCKKIVASSSSQVAASSLPSFHLISIPPLKSEGFVRNYRGDRN